MRTTSTQLATDYKNSINVDGNYENSINTAGNFENSINSDIPATEFLPL